MRYLDAPMPEPNGSTEQSISKDKLDQIRTELEEAIAVLADRHGIDMKLLKISHVSYTKRNFKVEIQGAMVDSSGLVRSPAVEDFKLYAFQYGFEREDVGQQFLLKGVAYKITGMDLRQRRFPILVERVTDGRRQSFDPYFLRSALNAGRM